MDSVKQIQVGVPQQYPPISPLSFWERVRVRGFLLLEVAQSIDECLILLRRTNRNPDQLCDALRLKVTATFSRTRSLDRPACNAEAPFPITTFRYMNNNKKI